MPFLLLFAIFLASKYDTFTTNNHLIKLYLLINLISIVILLVFNYCCIIEYRTSSKSNLGFCFLVNMYAYIHCFYLTHNKAKDSDTISGRGREYSTSRNTYTFCWKRKLLGFKQTYINLVNAIISSKNKIKQFSKSTYVFNRNLKITITS
jgi:hypothetical protein